MMMMLVMLLPGQEAAAQRLCLPRLLQHLQRCLLVLRHAGKRRMLLQQVLLLLPLCRHRSLCLLKGMLHALLGSLQGGPRKGWDLSRRQSGVAWRKGRAGSAGQLHPGRPPAALQCTAALHFISFAALAAASAAFSQM
jgi:hypothetical protein